jgi:hypothetical protein
MDELVNISQFSGVSFIVTYFTEFKIKSFFLFNPLKTAFPLNNVRIQFLPHRKHITSPLQSPTGECCLGKQSLFVVGTIQNTQIHSVGRMKNFSMLKQVVPLGL